MEKNLKTGEIIAFIRETKHLKLKEMTGIKETTSHALHT